MDLRVRYRGRYSLYSEEVLGLKWPPKHRQVIEDVCSGRVRRLIIKSNRGGGKSKLASVIEHILWFLEGYEVVNLGGSELQAGKVYGYQVGYYDCHPQIRGAVVKDTMSLTVHRDGQYIQVLAASQRQVRSPHVGGEHTGGLMVLDEECETEPEIVRAAMPIINTANPSVVIRLSTFHRAVGTFQETWDRAEQIGYTRYEWDCFDTCQPCDREPLDPNHQTWAGKERFGDCATCVPEFAYDKWRTVADREGGKAVEYHVAYVAAGVHPKEAEQLFVKAGPCKVEPFPEHWRQPDAEWEKVSEAYCGGRALHAEGWISLNEIVQAWREDEETGNIAHFEIEYLGSRPSAAGLVIADQEAWRRCFKPDVDLYHDPAYVRAMPGCYAIDWGMQTQCAVGHFFEDRSTSTLVLRALYLFEGGEGIREIGDVLMALRDQYGHNEVFPDSSHPYNNEYLEGHCGFDVLPKVEHRGQDQTTVTRGVVFGVWKDRQVGFLNAMIREGKFAAPETNAAMLKTQGQMWRRTDLGQIVKRHDHCCDMLLCGLFKWRAWWESSHKTASTRVQKRVEVPMYEM